MINNHEKNEKIWYNHIVFGKIFPHNKIPTDNELSEKMKDDATDIGNHLDNVGTKMAAQIS